MSLTVEELKLRQDRINWYVNAIGDDKQFGLTRLEQDVKDSKNKKVTAAIRISVLALALARGFIEVDDVPPKHIEEVCEKWLKEAPWRERDDAADRGTEVHHLAEKITNGEIVDIPPELANHVRVFRAFVDYYEVEFILTEFTVFSINNGYAGTGDFLARFGRKPEWGLILGDYKTSESGIWPDISLQLAGLRYADFIGKCLTNPEYHEDHTNCKLDMDRSTLTKVDTTVGVQITGNSFHVVPARSTKHHFNTFLAGLNISKWKTEGERFALDNKAEPLVDVK